MARDYVVYFRLNLKQGLRWLYSRSLRSPSHLIELRDWAAANKTDVITISEIWLNTSVTNCEVSIDGYKLYRQDRLRKRGGGVCAYIRRHYSHCTEGHFQFIW